MISVDVNSLTYTRGVGNKQFQLKKTKPKKPYYIDSCQNCRIMQGCKDNHGNHTCSKYQPLNELGLKPKKNKGMCSGCRDNYYNQNSSKSLDRTGCMSFKGATVIAKCVYYSLNQPPPYRAEWVLSCFHKQW